MPDVQIRGPVLILNTEDIQRAISYYRDTLGFELAGAMPEEEPTWCLLKRDDTRIMFLGSHDHDDEHEHEGNDHEHVHAPAISSLYFYPDDIDALWDELKDTVEIEHPLEDMDYGMREFMIRDPNGHALMFGSPISA